MARKYRRITFEDRKKIEKLYKEGVKKATIASVLGINEGTLCREIKRCADGNYSAEKAQRQLGR